MKFTNPIQSKLNPLLGVQKGTDVKFDLLLSSPASPYHHEGTLQVFEC